MSQEIVIQPREEPKKVLVRISGEPREVVKEDIQRNDVTLAVLEKKPVSAGHNGTLRGVTAE